MTWSKRITIASNLAYATAGLYVYQTGGPLAGALLIGCLALTIGSSWFHLVADRPRPKRYPGRLADRAGMYMVFAVLTTLALQIPSWWLVGLLWALLLAALSRLDTVRTLGLMGAIILTSLVIAEDWHGMATTIGLFGVASGARHMDQPDDTGLRHSLWHLLTAGMIAFLYQTLTRL